MRYKIIIILLFVLAGPVSSQTTLNPDFVGAEWIDESKTYYRVDIKEEGSSSADKS